MVENKQISKIGWIESKKQIADILTKKGVLVNLLKAVLPECHLNGSLLTGQKLLHVYIFMEKLTL